MKTTTKTMQTVSKELKARFITYFPTINLPFYRITLRDLWAALSELKKYTYTARFSCGSRDAQRRNRKTDPVAVSTACRPGSVDHREGSLLPWHFGEHCSPLRSRMIRFGIIEDVFETPPPGGWGLIP
jgi:hypothetical protein